MASYYRRFIQGFSTIARYLNKLLKKNAPFEWTHKQEKSFQTLKEKLTSAPVLVRPDWLKPFFVQTDGSAKGLGSVLTQKNAKGWDAVISYASTSTSETQANYSAYKLELLAIN